MILIKTENEIAAMRVCGKRHAEILEKLSAMVCPGVSTMELNDAAEAMVRDYGDTPAFLNYKPDGAKTPFPATLCVSVNDEIVHGIPKSNRILQEGDIVSLDLGIWHEEESVRVITDSAVTVPVGKISRELEDLLAATQDALGVGILAAQPGAFTGDVGYAIESFVNKKYGIVREFSGHGVGRHIHEDPYVPNFGKPGTGERLVPGMTIAIEPMLNIGKAGIDMLDDEWTIVTRDGKPSAHFEHTILITETGNEVLTKKAD